jgi:hypothetical protein
MIVRDEEQNLAACLESVADLMDEIVVVDTGSTDGTRDIARRFGARVFDFPWVDSFAAARNESIRHATGDWILCLDADERLSGASRTKLQRLLAGLGLENKAYGMTFLYLPEPGNLLTTEVKRVRLHRHHPQVRWRNRICEDIMPDLHALGFDVEWTDITIDHVGFQDPAARARKCERNLRLFQMDYVEDAGNPYTLFALGRMYHALERPADALPLLQRGLEHVNAGDPLGRGLHRLIVECHRLSSNDWRPCPMSPMNPADFLRLLEAHLQPLRVPFSRAALQAFVGSCWPWIEDEPDVEMWSAKFLATGDVMAGA